MRGAVATHWAELQHGSTTPAARAPRGQRGLTLLSGVLLATAAAIVLTRLAGLEPLSVLTGSMRPAIDPGDLVLVSRAPATAARPGDVITFASPDGRRRTITHRVVSVTPEAGELRFVTKGDANPAAERWSIPAGGRVGKVEATVPLAGYVAHPLAAGWTRGVLLGLLTAAGAAAALWLIWRPGRPGTESPPS